MNIMYLPILMYEPLLPIYERLNNSIVKRLAYHISVNNIRRNTNYPLLTVDLLSRY